MPLSTGLLSQSAWIEAIEASLMTRSYFRHASLDKVPLTTAFFIATPGSTIFFYLRNVRGIIFPSTNDKQTSPR